MLRDADALTDALHALKALGVRIVLDDFGTGYSSLGYLTRLPLDALKIDRSFVDGLGTEAADTAITEAIVAMSQALSLQVVGEGVETDAPGAGAGSSSGASWPRDSFSHRRPGAGDRARCSTAGAAVAARRSGAAEPALTDSAELPGRSGDTVAVRHSYAPPGIVVRSVAVSFGGITWRP